MSNDTNTGTARHKRTRHNNNATPIGMEASRMNEEQYPWGNTDAGAVGNDNSNGYGYGYGNGHGNDHYDDDDMIDPVALAAAIMNDDAARQNTAGTRNAILAGSLISSNGSGNGSGNFTGAGIYALGNNECNTDAREFMLRMINGPARMSRTEFLRQYRDWEDECQKRQRERNATTIAWALVVSLIVLIIGLGTLAIIL